MTDSQPRANRFNLHVPLSFKEDNCIVNGLSADVSESGISATFEKPLDIWTVGELTLMVDDFFLSIKVRVAREQGRTYGMAFVINNDNDRLAVGIMVNYASTHVIAVEPLQAA